MLHLWRSVEVSGLQQELCVKVPENRSKVGRRGGGEAPGRAQGSQCFRRQLLQAEPLACPAVGLQPLTQTHL